MALSISLLAKSMLALAVVTVAVLALSGSIAVLLAWKDNIFVIDGVIR